MQVKNWQIIEEGADGLTLENRVDLRIGRIRALAKCEATSDTRTEVRINDVFAELFWKRIPIGGKRDDTGYVEWMYVDERIRIQTGSKGSLFVHIRESEPEL